jgi:soluble lytic murein transglycosylase-like protein
MVSSMKKFIWISTFALAFAAPALAQSNNVYRFDNFDAPNSIRIQTLPTTASLPSSKTDAAAARPDKSAGPVNKASAPATRNAHSRAEAFVEPQPRQVLMSASKSLDNFTTGDAKIDAIIVESAARNRVDPVLVYSLMHQESSFKPRAVSYKGARGLMQLMPGTAARFGVRDIFDPRQNIEGGIRYLSFLLDMFDGDVPLSLAAYNAGEGAVIKYGRRIPPYSETQEYVRRIGERYQLMRNPEIARLAPAATFAHAQAVNNAAPVEPLYERSAHAVKLPDGKLMLVSQ